MKLSFLFIFCIFLLTACDDDKQNSMQDGDPSDLTLDVLVYDDQSGIVVVSVSANMVVEFQYYMDDGESNPFSSTDTSYEYKYEKSGSYLIEVRAIGSNGRYLKAEKRVLISADDPIDIGLGYTTPFSYEGMELVWNDEFDGTSLNEEYWCYDNGTGCPELCGWGNNELEYYKPENSWVQDGVFTIEARKEDFGGREYTSTKVVTRDKQSFHFGRIDIRATLPKGQGIWPALWLLGINQPTVGWPACGEIDIMEMRGGSGRENKVSANAFWDDNGTRDNPKNFVLSEGIFADKYHVFSLIWTSEKLEYFVDDQLFHTINISTSSKSEFQDQFYMIFNVAVGGNYPGNPDETTIFPTRMQVDYVRAFKFN